MRTGTLFGVPNGLFNRPPHRCSDVPCLAAVVATATAIVVVLRHDPFHRGHR